VRTIATSRNLLEQTLPKPALRPSVVTIVDRGGRTIFGRNVAPTASGLENVQDATDDTKSGSFCLLTGELFNAIGQKATSRLRPFLKKDRIEDDGAITRLGKSCDLQRTTWRTQVPSSPNRERLWALFRPGGLCRSAASPTRPGPRSSRPSQGAARTPSRRGRTNSAAQLREVQRVPILPLGHQT
jgi:hypothetical protein